jgi:hypothetical protein
MAAASFGCGVPCAESVSKPANCQKVVPVRRAFRKRSGRPSRVDRDTVRQVFPDIFPVGDHGWVTKLITTASHSSAHRVCVATRRAGNLRGGRKAIRCGTAR